MRLSIAISLSMIGLLGGCLVPQPIEPADETPHVNDPPRILGKTPAASTIRTQRGCNRVNLGLQAIEDLDEDDALTVRWFVNYDEGMTEPVAITEIPAGFGLQGFRTPSGASLELSLEPYRRPGEVVLVVEAVVSDGFDPALDREPRGRAVVSGKGSTEASWTVFVEVGECLQ